MRESIATSAVASEGKGNAGSFQADRSVESPGKRLAIHCLNAAIESFIVGRNLSRATLAEDLCGMTESNFSKVVNGVQGDFLALVYKLPGDIRADFFERLHQSERIDPVVVATEQLIAAAFHLLRMTAATLPEKATHFAKAAIEQQQQRKRA